MVQARNRRRRARRPALAERLGGVVDERFVGRVRGEPEALRALVAAVEEDDGAVGEQRAFDHAAPFGHRVELPFRRRGEGLDAAAGGVGRRGDVLVGTAAADDDVGCPLVGARQGEEDGCARVGVRAVVAREIGKGLGGRVGRNVKDLARLGDEDKEGAGVEDVQEGVHVVGLVLGENVHGDALALGNALVRQHLVRRVVVGRDRGVEAVERTRGDEDGAVGHGLRRCVPAVRVELVAGLRPGLAIERGVGSGAREVADCIEAVANGGVDEVERSVTAEREPATVGQKGTARAKGVCLLKMSILIQFSMYSHKLPCKPVPQPCSSLGRTRLSTHSIHPQA